MSCCALKKHVSVNRGRVNSGSGMTMQKKAAAKYSNISGGGSGSGGNVFSINGINNNNIFGYIGNPNSAIAYSGCKGVDNSVKTSVKTSKGYINAKLRCELSNSAQCNKISYASIDGMNLNKHLYLSSNNKDQSSHVAKLKAKCNYVRDLDAEAEAAAKKCDNGCKTKNSTSTNRTLYLARCCNVTKDINAVQVPDYNVYLGNLFKKKTCLYNPPDAKVHGC